MDQTISIFAEQDRFKLISFNPEPRAINCPFPEGVSIVVANSLTPSAKVETLSTRFNLRSVENGFALMLMLKYLEEEKRSDS